VHIPAIEVEAVDSTGAGDAFTAALAVSLAQGLAFREAARRASIVAALTVTRIGTQTAFPSLAEINEWKAIQCRMDKPQTVYRQSETEGSLDT
jgi:ribokinase